MGLSLLLPGARWCAGQSPAQDAAQQPAVAQDSPQNPSTQTTRVTLAGVVRDRVSGEPLPRALVQIEGDADAGALTDGEGRFEIPDVPVGPQTIRVAKPGYRGRPFPAEEPGLQADGPAHSVLVAERMPELVFWLTPNCAIHGRIELSTGDPATGMNVILLKQIVRSGRAVWANEGTARANGEGNYRFGGLPDGTYAVYTEPALETDTAVSNLEGGRAAKVARNGFASIFYPDARDLAGASRIRLSEGSQAEANFSLSLEPFFAVTAQAGDASAAKRQGQDANYTATLMDGSGQMLADVVQYDGATRSLQANLPNGSYTLVVHGATGIEMGGTGATVHDGQADRTDSFWSPSSGRAGVAGAVEFTVAGRAVNGLRVPLRPAQSATVRLRMIHAAEGSAPAFNAGQANDLVNLNLETANGPPLANSENIWSMSSGADAIAFTYHPGVYWLGFNVVQKGVCAGSFTAGGLNLAHDPLQLSLATAPPPMELTLRDDCGTMALSLPQSLASFLPGEEPFYTVYVVPDFDSMQDIPPMTMHASSGPTLTVDGLTPGSYHVYAFDWPAHLEYRNAAAMAALPSAGQQVTVSAGTAANVVLEVAGH